MFNKIFRVFGDDDSARSLSRSGKQGWRQVGGASASSAIRQRPELRLGGAGGMARQTRHAAYPRRALSSDDTGEDLSAVSAHWTERTD